ncbi:hypothetical protein HYH03_005067 [Edaphochlamys debaryana]|uniref:F-box domain-containing protein n=1 Tax=Edaphochlamys debaryana TaxID=47281 RepID=A0A835Y6R7_9CHLO|nr:hypothetical protein HYH03_005067 [Edaphochlamys debaryana]|eukprot:KAG2497071.1 hypothetical protein HYH03_005067 [Edaphochlamys debaryana]
MHGVKNRQVSKSGAGGQRLDDDSTCPHGSGAAATGFGSLPVDCLEKVFSSLPAADLMSAARVCRSTSCVANRPRVWSELISRTFASEEMPQDMSFLETGTAPQLRAAFRKLQLQRPALLSDAPRTSDILEEPGSRFRRVLHIDGRRDLNFTTCFTDVPPGDYAVLVRLQLQPGYVRRYCNFRAVFGRPSSSLAAKSTRKLAARRSEAISTRITLAGRLAALRSAMGKSKGEDKRGSAGGVDEAASGRGGQRFGAGGLGVGPQPQNLIVGRNKPQQQGQGEEREAQAAAAAAASGAVATAAFPEIEPATAPPQPPPPMPEQHAPQRAPTDTAAPKRDRASASGPRYVSRWLRPLWGSHDCAWHQLDPRGPLGEGAWRTLEMGSVTVRRLADVHLHQVMSQLPPVGAAQAAAAMPPGETRWRGVLVDYVELVPVKQCGLLEGLLPRCLAPRALAVPPAAAGQAPGAAVVHVPTL